MAIYERMFVVPEAAEVHELFLRVIKQAIEVGELGRRIGGYSPRITTLATVTQLERAYVEFNANLRRAAETGAKEAVTAMRDRFDATQIRPDTGTAPHLRGLLRAQPLPKIAGFETGSVGVANEAWLNRAINPRSRNPKSYWAVQEYGSGREGIPSQVGRILRGYFASAGGGDLERPLAQYAGGGGPHPVFISGGQGGASVGGQLAFAGFGPGARGGQGGFGTIGVEDPPRHFIRDGADTARIAWRAAIAQAQTQAIKQLSDILP